jgi:hypothetical protein
MDDEIKQSKLLESQAAIALIESLTNAISQLYKSHVPSYDTEPLREAIKRLAATIMPVVKNG